MLSTLALALTLSSNVDFREDVRYLFEQFRNYGAYASSDDLPLERLEADALAKFKSVSSTDELIQELEGVVSQLRDFHAFLGTNTPRSARLVPSGTDLYGVWKKGTATIEQVRPDSVATRAGVMPGAEIVRANGVEIESACRALLRKGETNERAMEWALNTLLAGTWDKPRILEVRQNSTTLKTTLPTAKRESYPQILSTAWMNAETFWLRPEDSLGDTSLIPEIHGKLPDMRRAKNVILDLRETPSGGNSTVARGIMGLFTDKRRPFQRHVFEERDTGTVRDWVEFVNPIPGKYIDANLYVLVSRWTGSMGEGIAIGLDAMGAGTVIGSRMAGLRGAVESFDLPVSKIRVFFPTERLFHVGGTPRHEWSPPIIVDLSANDPWREALNRTIKGKPIERLP